MTENRDLLWAVTSGDYDSYRVHAIFEDEADAKEAASIRHDYKDYQVEAMLVGRRGQKPSEMVTTYSLRQELRDDGQHFDHAIDVDTEPWFDKLYESDAKPRTRFVRAPVHEGKGGRMEVRGTDREAVLAAADDLRAKLLDHLDKTGKVGPVLNV